MPTIHDHEFGDITIRRSRKSRNMRASVAPNGSLRISIPLYLPLIMAKRMIVDSRIDLRKLLQTQDRLQLSDGMTIGKSHTLVVRQGSVFSIKRSGQQIVVTLGDNSLSDSSVDTKVREEIRKVLRIQAKHYLPKRLERLAAKYGYHYGSVRFSHASSRWGSCSSNGTISLNIALMMLPFELIDYVLLHELAHTKHMDHSSAFWSEVERYTPEYTLLRKMIKSYSPTI